MFQVARGVSRYPRDPMADSRPISGSGSCARCQEALGLASVERDGAWYCDSACAESDTSVGPREPTVPEDWLTARPRRFFGPRRPKELK